MTITSVQGNAISAIRCALADLIGAYQARHNPNDHDWESHLETIHEFAEKFGMTDEVPTDLDEDSGPIYNHAFTIAFTVETKNDAESVTADELTRALRTRMLDLADSQEIVEACGLPIDSYEVEP